MFNDLPKDLLEDIEKIIDPDKKVDEEDTPDADQNHTDQLNDTQLDSDKNQQQLGEDEDEEETDGITEEEDNDDREKEDPENKKKLKAGSSEELAAGLEPSGSGSGDSTVSEEGDRDLSDKSDEELVNDWNLLTDVSRNIKEDDDKPLDRIEALKAEIDKRQLIKDGAQIGKMIKKKENVKEDVNLVPTDVDGEYQIIGSTSQELLGKVVTDVYGTIVTNTVGQAFPGIPKVSRDMSLADIKKALDTQFLNEQVEDLDALREELESMSDDELVTIWNKLTFAKEALSDDVHEDAATLSLIRDILTDRAIVRGGIQDGKFINHLNIEKF